MKHPRRKGRKAAIFPAALALALSTAVPALADTVPGGLSLAAFDASRRIVDLPNSIHMAYVETGPSDGQPVVLIHGYTDSARDWWPLLPALSGKFRIIAVDLRGHGHSSKPECCYTPVDFAYDVKLLLDRLGIPKADIVGHSLGSIVTQSFAENWPVYTRRVVLISSTGGQNPAPTEEELKARKEGFDFRTPISQLKDPIDPDSTFERAWWSSPTPVDPDFIRRQREDSAHMPARVWLAVLDQGLVGLDVQPGLKRLTEPTLLIWGEKDPIMLPEVRQTLIRALPHAQVMIFPGRGHNPFWEDPPAVGAAINRFLEAP